jgi:hypothetical protein
MDVSRILEELKAEREQIQEAILTPKRSGKAPTLDATRRIRTITAVCRPCRSCCSCATPESETPTCYCGCRPAYATPKAGLGCIWKEAVTGILKLSARNCIACSTD